MTEDELTSAERAEIERVQHLLADPAMWAEPPVELQERVVTAIVEASRIAPVEVPRPRRWTRYALGAAAAAVLLAVGVTVGIRATQDHPLQYAAALSGTDLAPDATGRVTMTRTVSGWRIEVHATGLPRRADGEFYEAWLKNEAGELVPIGTFNDGRDVVLWAGVPPSAFPTMTVTREVADGNQASSGQVVLVGRSDRS